jgi:2-polyprenyl-3-methyl-5-hydroxy-6-metoxy-1,4-benzoquinol methylase
MSTPAPISKSMGGLGPAATDTHAHLRRSPFRWSDLWQAPLHDFPIRDEILLSYLPFYSKMDVLEVGPGSGFTAYWLARQARHLTLLDVAEEAVVELRQALRAVKNVEVVRWDLSTPGLANVVSKRFDAVFGLDVFEYIPDVSAFLANIHSVLRPGGCLFLTFPNVPPPKGDGVSWFSDISEVEELLRGAGFESWEVFAVRARPYARVVYAVGHEGPLRLHRRLRKGDRSARPQTYEATWTFRNRQNWARYRLVVHLWWVALGSVMRIGGPAFEAESCEDHALGRQLVVRAWR